MHILFYIRKGGKMNTEKYIEIAIFVVITVLLSTITSYLTVKKIEKLKKKEKETIINLSI